MTERPILFSAPMVRALLDGSKTQTRRIVKPADLARTSAEGPELWTGFMGWQSAEAVLADQSLSTNKQTRCPYGQPGDRLWVRETWAQTEEDYGDVRTDRRYVYRADGEKRATDNGYEKPWRPSIHMPRAVSRIMLEVVSVRIERLLQITEDDCYAEGIDTEGADYNEGEGYVTAGSPVPAARWAFGALWQSTGGDWEANPWVWVVEFKRLTP